MTLRPMFRLATAALILPPLAVATTILAAEPAPSASQPPVVQPAATRPAATPQAIAQWINRLGSDSYSIREAANSHLIQAGRSAIDAVAAASQKDDLEVTTRAIQILAAMLKSSDVDTVEAAADALAKIAAVRNASTATMAAAGAASDALVDYQERTLAEIQRLGGDVQIGDSLTGNPGGIQITLDSNWQGGSTGLKLLKHVPKLDHLAMHGIPITDHDLSNLNGLSQLRNLELYSTKVSVAASEQFARMHPTIQVDRRGAKLGIRVMSGSCQIDEVQPDTAAQRAGLMVNDIVLKFQGRAVNEFATLTANIGACQPGDKVTLEIRRGGQTLQKVVTLGDWK